jgi:hypothetical protein
MLEKTKESKLAECRIFDRDWTAGECETVAMASYPRSGNTLMRTWVERVMGIFSGSDGSNQGALH